MNNPIEFARLLRRHQGLTEENVWRILRGRQFLGLKFRRQVPVGPYFLDFACWELMLAVELDGPDHENQRAYDQTRGEAQRRERAAVR